MLRSTIRLSTREVAFKERFHTAVRGVTSRRNNIAFAFDIDGVLVKGRTLIPRAASSLQYLDREKIPFVFVTNGGGCTERTKADELSSKFSIKVEREMVLLSHSPMRELREKLSGKRVLCLGSSCQEIAKEDLGLENVITVDEVLNEWPTMYPFQGKKYYINRNYKKNVIGIHKPPVDAILILHDPLDWAVEAQVIVDILRGVEGDFHYLLGMPPGTGSVDGKQTPWYISNYDFTFPTEYPSPRFAAGAFADVVRFLYNKRFGLEAKFIQVSKKSSGNTLCPQKAIFPYCRHQYGKPSKQTFQYAEALIKDRSARLQRGSVIDKIYMVGDNPDGDIKGANEAGLLWVSNLVRTGVFCGSNADLASPADNVFEDVGECIHSITNDPGKITY